MSTSSLASTTASGITSIDGLISGLNSTTIINQLMAIQHRQVDLLTAKQQSAQTDLNAYRTINTKLLSLKSAAHDLAGMPAFLARQATTSDSGLITATGGSGAAVGSYSLTVLSTAKAHQIASQGYAASDAATGTGSIEISAGGVTTAITIGAADATLEGLRDAINRSDAAVNATIIDDGSGLNPYRLLITSEKTGTANSVTIAGSLLGGTSPVFNANTISGALAGAGNTYAGTATSGGTYGGASNKSYLVQIVDGGDLGVATYRVSEDGGQSWGTTQATGALINVYDDAHSTNQGVTLGLSAGTLSAGDSFSIDAYVPTVQAAADAKVALGSAETGITVTSASNQVTGLIPGVTLNLLAADADKAVAVSIERDTAGIKTKVQAFVDQYNSSINQIMGLVKYDAVNKQSGVLSGDPSIARVQEQVRAAMLNVVTGLSPSFGGLYALGISVKSDGTMSVNSEKLDAALRDHFDEAARLMAASGQSSSSRIAFVALNDRTRADGAALDVDITQAATQGTLTGAEIDDPAIGSIIIDDTNDAIALTVEGVESGVLHLSHGAYSSGEVLAAEIQQRINEVGTLSTHQVMVSYEHSGATGQFVLTAQNYGSRSSVLMAAAPANSAHALLGLDTATAVTGTDVQGTINGEPAIGSGQILSGQSGNATTEGLMLRVTLTPSELLPGSDGTITLTRGVAARVDQVLGYLTELSSGSIRMIQDGFQRQIDDLAKQITRQEDLLTARRNRLTQQFRQLESALRASQSSSTFLTQQLAKL